MTDNLQELREQKLDDALCPKCGSGVRFSNLNPSWCWTCRSGDCTAGGMWFGSRREAENNLLKRYYTYEPLD